MTSILDAMRSHARKMRAKIYKEVEERIHWTGLRAGALLLESPNPTRKLEDCLRSVSAFLDVGMITIDPEAYASFAEGMNDAIVRHLEYVVGHHGGPYIFAVKRDQDTDAYRQILSVLLARKKQDQVIVVLAKHDDPKISIADSEFPQFLDRANCFATTRLRIEEPKPERQPVAA